MIIERLTLEQFTFLNLKTNPEKLIGFPKCSSLTNLFALMFIKRKVQAKLFSMIALTNHSFYLENIRWLNKYMWNSESGGFLL